MHRAVCFNLQGIPKTSCYLIMLCFRWRQSNFIYVITKNSGAIFLLPRLWVGRESRELTHSSWSDVSQSSTDDILSTNEPIRLLTYLWLL